MKLVLAAKHVNTGRELFRFVCLSLFSAILTGFTKEEATVTLLADGA